jgi:hypothetical protein
MSSPTEGAWGYTEQSQEARRESSSSFFENDPTQTRRLSRPRDGLRQGVAHLQGGTHDVRSNVRTAVSEVFADLGPHVKLSSMQRAPMTPIISREEHALR